MSVADDFTVSADFPMLSTTPPVVATPNPEPASSTEAGTVYHRIAKVRRQQEISIRSAARRMGIPMEQVRNEERPDSDLSLSDLVRWQQALEVPMADLLVEQHSPLSTPVLARAKWLRLMKTVKAISEASESTSITRMATMLEQQVLEVMPELEDVSGWHTVGQRRTQDEYGRTAEAPVSSNFARDGLH